MKVRLISIGQRMPDWVNIACKDYHKRLQPMMPVELIELPMAKRTKTKTSQADIEKLKHDESQRILSAVKANDYLVCLDVNGKSLSTEALAQTTRTWMLNGQDVTLVIGGPDGLSAQIIHQSQWRWSLSKLTLPHQLVRVMVIEQLYRAMSINNNHPYHRS